LASNSGELKMNTTELRTQDEAGLAKEIKDLQRAHFM
jgi:hypothetical protein